MPDGNIVSSGEGLQSLQMNRVHGVRHFKPMKVLSGGRWKAL